MSVITDIVSGIAGTIGKAAIDIRTAITGVSPETAGKLAEIAANLEAQKERAETELLQGQLEINKVEAASPNIWIAGWRPFIGWVCGAAFVMNFVLLPIAQWIIQIIGVTVPITTLNGSAMPVTTQQPLKLFDLDLATILPVLLGLLGLGGMRTYEKVKSAQGNH
jgi:hypothetical protein